MIYRRQRNQYIFAGVLVVIAVVNVLFYFILNRPAQAEYRNLQDSITRLGTQVKEQQQYLGKLEKTNTQLGSFDQDRKELFKHFLHRENGYSEIMQQIDELVRRTGVKWTRVNLPIQPLAQFGLYALGITIPLEGNYANVVNFIHQLEQSNTFFLVTGIGVETTTDSTQPNAAAQNKIALSLMLETYFYQ